MDDRVRDPGVYLATYLVDHATLEATFVFGDVEDLPFTGAAPIIPSGALVFYILVTVSTTQTRQMQESRRL